MTFHAVSTDTRAAGYRATRHLIELGHRHIGHIHSPSKSPALASERLLGGVRKQVKEGELKAASFKVSAAAASSGKTLAKLKQVVQPTADAAKLAKWLGYLETEQKLLGELSKTLKAENKSRVQRLTITLTHNGNLANNAVLGFDFDYCLIPTDQFS